MEEVAGDGLLTVVGGVVGLIAGSFLNVVAYRVPRGLSVVRPRSACPGCGHEIRSRDNVPVLSWLLLRGRCRDCGSGISMRYPLVEAGTAAAFAAAGAAARGVLGAPRLLVGGRGGHRPDPHRPGRAPDPRPDPAAREWW